jgi:hypothetical protein
VTVPGGRQTETDRYSIDPDASQAVKVIIPTRYIRSREPYEKNDIKIETNDPDNGLVRLAMKFQVYDVLVITPDPVHLGTVKPLSEGSREVTITNRTKKPVTLTRLSTTPQTALKVSRSGGITLEPGSSVTVSLTYKPSAPQKNFLGLFQIETSMEGLPLKTVQVKASAAGK